jgi:ribosomal protein S27E
MPLKDHSSFDDDDEKTYVPPQKARFFEFECPLCDAHNPWPDGFGHKEEVNCLYCGSALEARVNDDLKVVFREL